MPRLPLVLALAFAFLFPSVLRAQPAFFAFVLLAEDSNGQPVAIARAVVEGATRCPVLQHASGAWQEMTPRRRPDGRGFARVLVCETLYPLGQSGVVLVADKRLALPAVSLDTPRRVLLLGDSGCRGEVQTKPQSCAGAGFGKTWPFGTIVGDERRPAPDLIVHVGDYNYRNTPRYMTVPSRVTGYGQPLTVPLYDPGDLDDDDEPELPPPTAYWSQNIEGSPIPDTWPAWREDFFVPAERLLGVAPWIFVRGNHELCSRAGLGWFYLLDPHSPLLGPGRDQLACPAQTPRGFRLGVWPKPPALPFLGDRFPIRLSEPYRVKLGALDIIAVDSADAGDAFVYNVPAYAEQYRKVARMLDERRPTWLATHRPIWGVVKKTKGLAAAGEDFGFVNLSQQTALALAFRDGLPSNVTAVLSGHIHRFQATTFGGRRPPQLVAGTSGMELSNVYPIPPKPDDRQPIRVPKLDGMDATVVGLMEFGAMVLEPGHNGAWTGDMISSAGKVVASCDSRWADGSGRSVCALK